MFNSETYTITFGDLAENNVGMQKLGTLSYNGFTLETLEKVKLWFDGKCKTELILLNDYCKDLDESVQNAYLLIVRNGLDSILSPFRTNDFYEEQRKLSKDSKALMYGRVVNKKARHNLCFGEIGQPADFSKGKGTVYASTFTL